MKRISLQNRFITACAAAILTFLVYLPALENDFVNWDDNVYIYENSFIRSLDAQLFKSAFAGFHASNWHPLTWISHAIDYAVWGLNPRGHHLTNIVLHALNTFIVVILMTGLMEMKRIAGDSGHLKSSLNSRAIGIAGAATGLLFGLHPLHVESVAWVAERKDLLCAFFFLLSVVAYAGYAGEIKSRTHAHSAAHSPIKKYLCAMAFFVLSLLSKPMAVTLPFVLLILDWYLFGRIQSLKEFRRVAMEKLPFFVLALISSVLTLAAQQMGGAIKSVEIIPVTGRIVVAASSAVAYLEKMVLPLNLVPFYPYPERMALLSIQGLVPIVIVIAITGICIALLRKQPIWLAVWSYYVITLIPVLGIVQVGFQAMADRYTYLPSLGPFLVIGLISARYYERAATMNRWNFTMKLAGIIVAATAVTAMSYATVRQIGVWKDSFVFWNYVIQKEPSRVPIAYNNLGVAYSSAGLIDKAIEQYQTALRLNPGHVDAYNNLGNAYLHQGLIDKAMEQYQTALRLNPGHVDAYNNLGNAYLHQGLIDRAIEQYHAALTLKPGDAEAHYNLGVAFSSQRLTEKAIEQFLTALRLRPGYIEAHNNLGNAYLSQGLIDEAIKQYLAVLSLKPASAEAHYNLGLSYLRKGLNDLAQKEFELAATIRQNKAVNLKVGK